MKLQLTEYQVKRILELLSEEENEKINVMFVGDSLSAAPGFTWNYLLARKRKKLLASSILQFRKAY